MAYKLDDDRKYLEMPIDNCMCKTTLLAHAYVPWQFYTKAFCPQEALIKGTLFPELYGPYLPPK